MIAPMAKTTDPGTVSILRSCRGMSADASNATMVSIDVLTPWTPEPFQAV